MLALHYGGWCQIRLATNPDPTDEPRGVSGYSFAVAGEPDFDRCVRFQDPVCARVPGPQVGVTVQRVSLKGTPQPGHPMVGAAVALLNEDGEPPAHPRDARGPRFEARGYILADPGDEPLWPYHIRFTQGETVVERAAAFAEPWTGKPIVEVPWDELVRFGATSAINSTEVAAATGITDFIAFRLERRAAVEAALAEASGEAERAALGKRLAELVKSPSPEAVETGVPTDRRTFAMGAIQTRDFALTGAARVQDEAGVLGTVDESAPWPTTFWFGGWDCDALCCYVSGTVLLPLAGPEARGE